jgi:hypothetical protein
LRCERKDGPEIISSMSNFRAQESERKVDAPNPCRINDNRSNEGTGTDKRKMAFLSEVAAFTVF